MGLVLNERYFCLVLTVFHEIISIFHRIPITTFKYEREREREREKERERERKKERERFRCCFSHLNTGIEFELDVLKHDILRVESKGFFSRANDAPSNHESDSAFPSVVSESISHELFVSHP